MSNELINAIERDDFNTALQLIEANQNNIINTPDSEGNYPLHLAANLALYDHLSPTIKAMLHQIALALLQNGANPNVLDHWGSSPIHYAATHGNLELFKKLVEHGANYNLSDLSRETPLHQAIRRKHDAIINYLLSKEELECSPTLLGDTPIDYAARYNHTMKDKLEDRFKPRWQSKFKPH